MELIKRFDEQEEQDFADMQRLGLKHHIPIPQSFVDYEVIVGDKVELRSEGRAHSFVRNLYNFIAYTSMAIRASEGGTYGAGGMYAKRFDTGVDMGVAYGLGPGMTATYDPCDSGHGVRGSLGSVYNGIIIGTSNAAWSFDDYQLGAAIENGNGAGQVIYNLMDAYNLSYNAGTLTWTLVNERLMNNNSGGGINVEESCIVTNPSTFGPVMYSRDLTGGIVLPNYGQFRVTYTFTLTYPA